MSHRRVAAVIALAAASCCVAGGVLPAGAAARAPVPAPAPVTLIGGISAFPPRLHVLAADATTVLYATQEYGETVEHYVQDYYTVPVGGGAVRKLTMTVDDGNLGGSAAGSTYIYSTDLEGSDWLDLDSGASGPGPEPGYPDWETAIPGAGVWLDTSGRQARLYSTTTAHPEATPTLLATLSDIPSVAGDYVIGGTTGVAVVSGTTIDWYSLATHAVRRLSSSGLGGSRVVCESVTVGTVGCASGTRIFRVPTDGSRPTSFPGAHLGGSLVVTPVLTAWRDTSTGRLVSRSIGGTVTRSAGPVGDFTAAGNGVASSAIAVGRSTVYAGPSAAAQRTLVIGRSPLVVSTVALTSGRAAWIDDSGTGDPVRSRGLVRRGTGFALGPVSVLSRQSSALSVDDPGPDYFVSGLGASGSRTVFTTGSGDIASRNVVLADATGRHVIGHSGDGNVAISGTRILYGSDSEDVLLYDIARHRTRNLSAALGLPPEKVDQEDGAYVPLTGVGYGRYVVYEKKGVVLREDLVTGRSTVVGRTAIRRSGFADARTAGDWVAWTTIVNGARRVLYRNARTLGRTFSLPGWRLTSVSQAGLVGTNAQHTTEFQAWGSTVTTTLPAGATVSGPRGEWIGRDGLPRVAVFAAGAARPQALGAPIAAATSKAGRAWRLDQPTSQALTACRVVIRNPTGRIVANLRCNAAFTPQGEAVATWNTRVAGRPAQAGRYRWQVIAGDGKGPLLSSTGTPGTAVAGVVVVSG